MIPAMFSRDQLKRAATLTEEDFRGVQHQRIYRIDPNRDYGSLASLVSRADQTIDTGQIAEAWVNSTPRSSPATSLHQLPRNDW
jgi:hypothetical protein